ncbi:MAG: RNA polymerase sigma factor [Actinomycetota bacterium]
MWRPKRDPGEERVDPVPPELVERCKRGDERAWGQLVDATYRDVFSLCLRILGDTDDAAEATQDAYLKAWRGLQGFRGDSMFSTWLYRVASNAALSKHRSRRRRQAHETGADDEMLTQMTRGEASTEDAAAARVDVSSLEDALALLPEHYRSAIVLKDVYGYSIREIAKQVGCSETAAKVRIHRARKRLKELVYPDEEA